MFIKNIKNNCGTNTSSVYIQTILVPKIVNKNFGFYFLLDVNNLS